MSGVSNDSKITPHDESGPRSEPTKMGPFADDLNINDDYYSDLIKDSNNMEPTNSKMVPREESVDMRSACASE